jgi:hypothetical protein
VDTFGLCSCKDPVQVWQRHNMLYYTWYMVCCLPGISVLALPLHSR